MNAVLPFDGFLDVLRTKGYAVGLRERFALATLLERWEGTSSAEFRDALAALVGRSDDEVQGIRRLFNDLYNEHLEAPAALSPHEPSAHQDAVIVPPQVRTFPSRWAWTGAALAVVIVLGFVVWRINQPTASTQPAAPPVANVPPAAPEPATTALPPRAAPAPSVLDWSVVAGAFGAVFLAALSVFWILENREARRHWLRHLWSTRFTALPGPRHFNLTVRGRPAGLARADVEDAVTLLGRAFATETPARELDVRRSVRLTLRQGLFPRVVFKQRRVTEAILVFEDVCQDMEVCRPKIERFLTDVARQGVTLDRYYFDGDIRRVTHRPHRAAVPFDIVMRRRPDAPVLILSTGTALAALLDQGDDHWLIALRNRLRRSWLSPLVDVRLWPTELGTLPIHVWPMTRRGLIQAAKDLAGIQGEAPAVLKERIASEGLVTQDGIERMKRLASLVPHPTIDLLEALRLRFAPDVSDAVVVHLFAETGSQPAPVLRLGDEEVRRCLNAVRGETPRLEADVRQAIVETLRDSEPPAGSAAHLRWQAALSLQELVLADLQGADATRPLAALQELGQGPTWEEIRRAASLVPSAPSLTDKLDAALGTDVGRNDGVPPSVDQPGVRAPWPWLWPGPREIISAALLVSSLAIVAGLVAVVIVAAVAIVLRTRSTEAPPQQPPEVVQVTPPATPPPTAAAPPPTEPAPDTTKPPDTTPPATDPAQLPATTEPAAPPAAAAVTTLFVDVRPWARVKIVPAAPDPAVPADALYAPFAVDLPPGTYTFECENGGVTRPLTFQITVAAGPPQAVTRNMPGFNATKTVDLASLPVSAQQNVDWQDLYRQAITHVQRREWKPAEDKLLAAMKAGPESGRGVIRRFMDRDDYYPEFYLGVVYLNTGRVGAALVQFQLARKNDVNTRTGDFRQLSDLENRARSILEAESRKVENENPNPSAQFKTFMDRAQRALGEGRFDEAEGAARQARNLNVDNAAADSLVQNIERTKNSAALQQELAKSPSLAELRRLRTEYEGKGVSLDEVIRLIAAGEAVEARARGERTGMIEFYAGNYQKAVAAIAEAEKAAPLSARGHFYRACSLASLAMRGKTVSQNQLREARRAYATAAEQADQLKNELRFISPRLLQLLKGS